MKLKTMVFGLGLALAASSGVGTEAGAQGATRRAEPPGTISGVPRRGGAAVPQGRMGARGLCGAG